MAQPSGKNEIKAGYMEKVPVVGRCAQLNACFESGLLTTSRA